MKILLLTFIALVLIVSCNAMLGKLFTTIGVLSAAEHYERNRESSPDRAFAKFEDMAMRRIAEYVTKFNSYLDNARALPVANQNPRSVIIVNPVQNTNQVPVLPGYQLVNTYTFEALNASPFQNNETRSSTETDPSSDES